MDLEHDTMTIYSLLYRHKGRKEAIKSPGITGQTGIDDNRIRRIVRRLRNDLHPIGSGPEGFWWITDPQELREFLERYEHRAFTILATVSRQRNQTALEMAGQLKAFLEG